MTKLEISLSLLDFTIVVEVACLEAFRYGV